MSLLVKHAPKLCTYYRILEAFRKLGSEIIANFVETNPLIRLLDHPSRTTESLKLEHILKCI